MDLTQHFEEPTSAASEISQLSESISYLDDHQYTSKHHAAAQTDPMPNRELQSQGVQVFLTRKKTVTTGSQTDFSLPVHRTVAVGTDDMEHIACGAPPSPIRCSTPLPGHEKDCDETYQPSFSRSCL
ncbi:uncharacterized protein LOC119407232 [Rhipicephalus sanguineus]|uniref:uncharacterized protein LOC119407232 n=1 Tax=Rhipicephalus sanguineus TaxID=34632 RepID=UPI00189378A7|nr:uncharacterized protein LOC119407232 [Rhipicephalus sanguineus]